MAHTDRFDKMVAWIDLHFDPVIYADAPWLDNDEDRENLIVELIDKTIRRDGIEAQTGFLLAEYYDVPLPPALGRYLVIKREGRF